MRSFREIIDAFPSRQEFGDSIGVSLDAVNKMHQRDSVGAKHDSNIVAACVERGIPVGYEVLARIRSVNHRATPVDTSSFSQRVKSKATTYSDKKDTSEEDAPGMTKGAA